MASAIQTIQARLNRGLTLTKDAMIDRALGCGDESAIDGARTAHNRFAFASCLFDAFKRLAVSVGVHQHRGVPDLEGAFTHLRSSIAPFHSLACERAALENYAPDETPPARALDTLSALERTLHDAEELARDAAISVGA